MFAAPSYAVNVVLLAHYWFNLLKYKDLANAKSEALMGSFKKYVSEVIQLSLQARSKLNSSEKK